MCQLDLTRGTTLGTIGSDLTGALGLSGILSGFREGGAGAVAAAAAAGSAAWQSGAAWALRCGQHHAPQPRARLAGPGRAVQVRRGGQPSGHLPHHLGLSAGDFPHPETWCHFILDLNRSYEETTPFGNPFFEVQGGRR